MTPNVSAASTPSAHDHGVRPNEGPDAHDADVPPAADGVLAEKLRHSPRDGLGTLDVQQVTDAIDRALVDLRQR
jgi:hypothetical protein